MTPATSDAMPQPSVRVDGSDAVIRLPAADALALRPALRACPCRAPKSIATNGTRDRFRRAVLADRGDGIRWPVRELLDLRVALTPCRCLESRDAPGRDLLVRLGAALTRAGGRW